MLGSWSLRKKEPVDKGVTQSPEMQENNGAQTSDDEDTVSEYFARILRSFGRNAFDLEELSEEDIEKEFEQWARHVLVGAPVGQKGFEAQEAKVRRDWGELARFVNSHRQQEKKYVTRNLQEVRGVLLEFTKTVGCAMVEDQTTDQKVENYVDQLRTASEAGSFQEVKQALSHVVKGINTLLNERKERQQQRIAKLGEKLRSVERELGSARKQMMLDPLTQLNNRGGLDLQLERTASVSFFSETPASLFMIDIDHFKQINDMHGHPAGDAVLKQLADCLVSTFPRKTDFIARYGGEEFSVLLPGASLDQCQRLGERLLEAIRSTVFLYEDVQIPVTASVGIAELMPGETVPTWLERADRALYRAKDNGRNQVCLAKEITEKGSES